MKWSPQQDAALKAVDHWFYQESKRKKVFYVAGYAGTGKTTLAKHFASMVDGLVLFAAFTGKAALVMRKNGCIGARTIHSLVYIAEVNETTGEVNFRVNKASPLNDANLLIVDECSMVDEELGRVLLSFNKPILVLGDPAQLPPPNGAGFFTEKKPDVMLTEIHRQAEENPIIYLASQVRNGIYPDVGEYGDSKIVTKMTSSFATEADQIIVGRNITRDDMNRKMRRILNMQGDIPNIDEKLICLKNDKDLGIFNGGMFRNKQVLEQKYKTNFLHMRLQSDDEEDAFPTVVKVHKSFFVDEVLKPEWKTLKGSQEFDFAYAITCHKSQGSQWKNSLIIDESWCFRDDWKKWLYTAITRNSEKLILVK